MKAYTKALGSLFLVVSAMGLTAPKSLAEKVNEDPLGSHVTIPEAVDYNARMNRYFDDDSTIEDAKFFTGLTFGEKSIRRSGRQIEAVYQDLLKQQDDDHPIVRTRDLPSPFTTSVFTLQSPTNFSEISP